MPKRLKILVSVLVAVALLTAGGAATVMAQDEPVDEEPEVAPYSENRLLDKVAEILGITPEELISIFEQAKAEMQEEAFISYLDQAVADGLITQPEADEIAEWWLNRPAAVDRLHPGARIFKAVRARWQITASDNASGRSAIIQEKVNRIREQWQNRVENQNCPQVRARIFKAIRGQQQMAVPRGWGGGL